MALSGFMIGPKHLIIQCCFLILLIAYYTFFLKDPFVIENAAIYLLSTIGFTAVMHFVIKTIYKFIANLEILTDKYNALQQEAVNKNTFLEIAYNEINSQKEEIIAQKDELSAQHNLVSLQKEKIENIHQNLSDSINYAKQIQDAMLPTKAVTDLLLKNYFIIFNPKDIVSGDFYWIHKFKNYLVVAVADCTGHGVPGAFMSMLGISFLNEIVKKNEIISPSKILDHLRDSIIDALKQRQSTFDQNDGMDIAICIINTDTLELNYAGANNPCWIVNSQQSSVDSQQSLVNSQQSALANSEQLTDNSFLIELKPDKQPIGIHTNMQPFTNNSFQLQKGDVMYLMSDGYADQFGGPEHKKFQTKKFKTLLLTNSQLPMPDQKQTLETTINEWIGNYEQTDDITILGIKF
jgi:serine phosphatase RsbU (regulator of sigma subunit)